MIIPALDRVAEKPITNRATRLKHARTVGSRRFVGIEETSLMIAVLFVGQK
jgi:hypothetical protein